MDVHLLKTLSMGVLRSDAPAPEQEKSLLKASIPKIDACTGNIHNRPPIEESLEGSIAVVGMSCRVAGAETPEEFWNFMAEGKDGIRGYPTERPFPLLNPSRAEKMQCGFLRCSVDEFDAQFFGVSPREAKVMDPQQRLLLEVTWEGLENAGINPHTLRNTKTGIYVGIWQQDYEKLLNQGYPVEFTHKCLGTMLSSTASRISYHYGLAGPAMAIEAGCSSALQGLNLACSGLREGSIPLAIVGGVNLVLVPIDPYSVMPLEPWIHSPDFKCKTFDEGANGYVRGEAISVVVLKRYADAKKDGDNILALIRGSAANHDGSANGSTSFGTPNGAAQENVYRTALSNAGLMPADVSYVETHGTGTAVGDPVEVGSLGRVYSEGRTRPLILGSLKTNVGHSEAASGLVSLIKVILCMRHGSIPPQLNLKVVNPKLNLDGIPAMIPLSMTPWEGTPRIAAVTTFSLTGLNVHVLIQEPPTLPETVTLQDSNNSQLVLLSAKSTAALQAMRDNMAGFLRSNSESLRLQDLAYTLVVGRAHFSNRLALVVSSEEQLIQKLEGEQYMKGRAGNTAPSVGFLFSGQGSQYQGMARALYDVYPEFKQAMDICATHYAKLLDKSLFDVIWKEDGLLEQTLYCQPAIFCVQYAISQLWKSFGVRPIAVLGHSAGEFAAAVAADVFSLGTGLEILVGRSKLVAALSPGAMIAFRSTEEQIIQLIQEFYLTESGADRIDIAAINSPSQIVVSGRPSVIQEFGEFCSGKGLTAKNLRTSHAFHSREMEPILKKYMSFAGNFQPNAPTCKYVSSSTARTMTRKDFEPGYWAAHLRDPVQFSKALKVIQEECGVFIEIGAQPVLIGLALANGIESDTLIPTIRPKENDVIALLNAVGKLYVAGISLDLTHLVSSQGSRRVSLPHYPFQRKKYWIESAELKRPIQNFDHGFHDSVHPLLGRQLFSPGADLTFAQEWNLNTLLYVEEHKIASEVIAPAAIFVESFLAGVRETLYSFNTGMPIILENIKIQNALQMTQPCLMQTTLHPNPLPNGDLEYILTSHRQLENGQNKWQLHASASFEFIKTDVSSRNALGPQDSIRGKFERMIVEAQEMSHDEVYQIIAQAGIRFGPKFRTINKAWIQHTSKSIVVEVTTPADTGSYICHPILLDAILQSFVLRQGIDSSDDKKGVSLLIGIQKLIWLSQSLTQKLYTHVDTFSDDVVVFNSEHVLVCRLEGVEILRTTEASFLRTLRSNNAVSISEYEDVWILGQVNTSTIKLSQPSATTWNSKQALEKAVEYEAEQGWIFPILNQLYALFLVRALHELQWPVGDVDTLEDNWKTRLPSTLHPRLLTAFRLALRSLGSLPISLNACSDQIRDIKKTLDSFLDTNADIQLAYKFGKFFPSILRGDSTGLNFFFPDDPTELGAARFYRESEAYTLTSELSVAQVLDTITHLVEAQEGVVRILEVGAGSGVTTLSLTRKLQMNKIPFEYTFTDISPYFLQQAKLKLDSSVDYAIFNIEIDPLSQGFAPNSFDIVLCVDVLHATRDVGESMRNMGQILRPNGRLVFTEMLRSEPIRELSWGMLEGWWGFKDFRTTSPLLGLSKWMEVLQLVGFEEITSLSILDGRHGSITATKGDAVTMVNSLTPRQKKAWIIFTDGSRVAESLERNLEANGRRVIRISWRSISQPKDEAGLKYELNLDPEDLPALIDTLRNLLIDTEGFVYLWTSPEMGDMGKVQRQLLFPLLQVYKALLALDKTLLPPKFFLVLRGVHCNVTQEAGLGNPSAATAWGFIKTIGRSSLDLRIGLIDLDPASSVDESEQLFAQLWRQKYEPFVALRGNSTYAQRLVQSPKGPALLQFPISPRYEVHRAPGGDFVLKPSLTTEIRPGFVEVEIKAFSFDKLTANSIAEGLKVVGLSGTVMATGSGVTKFSVGDPVMGITISALIGSHAQVPDFQLIQKPVTSSFTDAAGLSSQIVAAYSSLVLAAGLTANDRVLILNTDGSFTLAAIQIAQRIGAQIFVVAGSTKQQNYLKSVVNMKHVYSALTSETVKEIQAVTGDLGISVILNTGPGSSWTKETIAMCSKGARFVEVGIPSSALNSTDAIQQLRPDVEHVVAATSSDTAAAAIAFLDTWIHTGQCSSLPMRLYPLTQLGSALAESTNQVGNLCLTLPSVIRSTDGPLLFEEKLLNKESTYLITGGLGGLGLEVTKWMVEHGAGNIVLVGRGILGLKTDKFVSELGSARVSIVVTNADIGNLDDCTRVLGMIRLLGLPPLRGIVHAAGVLADDWVEKQSWEMMQSVLWPKVYGAWHLHQLTLTEPLHFFILFSSMSSFFSIPTQSNYAAANRFLDALAHYRAAMGLPATSINWGAWSDVGQAANLRIGQDGVGGVKPFTPVQGIRAFERALSRNVTQTGIIEVSDWSIIKQITRLGPYLDYIKVADARKTVVSEESSEAHLTLEHLQTLDPDRLQETIDGVVRNTLRRTLGLQVDEVIEEEQEFDELGIDSLMAMELRGSLQKRLQNLPVSLNAIQEKSCIKGLVSYLVSKVDHDPHKDI